MRLIDPDDESIYVLRPDQPIQVLQGNDHLDLQDVVPGSRPSVRELFDAVVPAWLREGGAADRSPGHRAGR